jgi:RNase P/RNase MRP subunit POP5
MADRKDTVELSAILKAASAGEQVVRFSAINALGRVGNASCVPTLLQIASDSDTVLAQNAKTALSELPDASISQEILSRLPQAKGKELIALIEVVGQRRIEATAELLKALANKDEAVRGAALTSLGATVPPDRMSVLITQVVSPKFEEDSATALKAAAVRMPDREACAAEIASALSGKSIATQTALLDILANVGGTNALKAVAEAGKSSEPLLKDASSKLLGDWMTIDAAPVLLDLATTGPADKYQVRSIRGYIRIARQFVMSDADRIAMCQKAFEISKAPNEKKLLLEVLKRYPSLENLKLAIKTAEVADLKDESSQVAQAIAEKVGTPEAKELVAKAGLEKK